MNYRLEQRALPLVLLLVAACTSKEDTITPDPAGAGAASGATGGGGTAGSGGTRPTPTSCRTDRPGAEMVLVPKPGGAFCIDKTEATRQHYADFLKAAGEKPTDTRADCKEDTTHRPFLGPKTCADNNTPLEPKFPNLAIGCVDWCDARAFCEWAGKRLCEAASMGVTKGQPEKAGEWNLACSGGGKTMYPYGDTYEPGRCQDSPGGRPADGMSAFEPASTQGCRGTASPYDELRDMSGGMHEWASPCHKSENGLYIDCPSMGGSYADGPGATDLERLNCWTPLDFQMLQPVVQLGIRCCADD